MDPDEVSLEDISKMFEYEKISRVIDSMGDIDQLKNIVKCYIKLYLKQQETIFKL